MLYSNGMPFLIPENVFPRQCRQHPLYVRPLQFESAAAGFNALPPYILEEVLGPSLGRGTYDVELGFEHLGSLEYRQGEHTLCLVMIDIIPV